MNKDSSSSQSKPLVKPSQPQGTLPIAGENITIGAGTVHSTPGSSQSDLIKGLQRAKEEEIFTPSPSPESPEENHNEQ